jgi:hypothetical protein
MALAAALWMGLSATALASPPTAAGARGSVKTDLGIYPAPVKGPKLPAAGGTFVDPTFGTTIMRVTDEKDGKDNHLAYSYYATYNKDSTRMFGWASGDAASWKFDAKKFQLGEKTPLFADSAPAQTRVRWEDAAWSGKDSDAIYAHDTMAIWKYDFKTKAYTLLKDFKKDLGYGIKQMSRSLDDDVWAFCTTDAEGKQNGAIAYSVKANKVLFRDEEADLDEVQVDKSGGYLVVKRNQRGKDVVWVKVADLKTGKVEGLIDTAPDFATGHSDNGTGMLVGSDDKVNRFTKRLLRSPHKFISILDLKNDWTQAAHVSCLADDERACVISFYEWKPADKPGPFHSEIIEVSTDGSQRVRRLAHTRVVMNQEYWNCPFANISRDGKFIAFGSNMGDTGRRDIYVLKGPPGNGR